MTLEERTKDARDKYDELIKIMGGREILFWREAELLYEFKTSRDYKFVFGNDSDDRGKNYFCSKCKKMFFESETMQHRNKHGKLNPTKHCKICDTVVEFTPQSWRWFVDEIGVPLSTADYKTKTYGKWVIEMEYTINALRTVPSRKLHISVPYVTDKKRASEIFNHAKILPFYEFQTWLKETYTYK